MPASSRRSGCNAMARPAFRKVDRSEETGGARLVHLDRDRPLVDAARADPAQFDALYRKYLAQVYSYAFYELGDHHEAEDATERTFLAALANLPRFEERARPVDGEGASTFRVWLFPIARNVVAERRRRRRRRPETTLDTVAELAGAARPRGRCRPPRRGPCRAARREPADRRPSPRGRPALRRRDVHRRDRRDHGPLRGLGPRPHPPGAAERRARPRRGPRSDPAPAAATPRRSRPSSPTATSSRC